MPRPGWASPVGPEQEPGTTTTDSVQKTKEVGPQGQVIEKEVKTTSSKRDHAVYKYSGLPCKWTGGVGNTGANADLVKDTGPKVRYTVDRLPAGANPEEALWVKMRDGRMMMVDPKIVQDLPRNEGPGIKPGSFHQPSNTSLF